MIAPKLSQGAKPGHVGVLPGPKATPDIAAARGAAVDVDCVSPAGHSAFGNPVEMMQLIDRLRRLSGVKPTGFKLCIGHPWGWFAICKGMLETGILPDCIVVDGADCELHLLADHLACVKPGALLAAAEGRGDWPHDVFRQDWPPAQADSFRAASTQR